MPLRYLFVDMNSYFASCEQHDRPELRGKPVAVVPVLARTTSAIAASVEAKRFGVKTGTPVWDMERLCPGIRLVQARPERYVRLHHAIVEAVNSCLPVERIMSIDEMSCRLVGEERHHEVARAVGQTIKDAIRRQVGETLRCSVGIGPNEMLAKVAADMEKPDGMTVIDPVEMPDVLYQLQLTDFPGIGPRMERRLHAFGVTTVKQLCELSPAALSHVWGSRVHGWGWWYRLRGEHIPEKPTVRRTLGHSHVLPPELRTADGSTAVLVRLLHKAAARLRRIDYWAGAMTVYATFLDAPAWSGGRPLGHLRDTYTLLRTLRELWDERPAGKPVKVGLVLGDLVPARAATPSLFEEDRRWERVSDAMDEVNAVYGPTTIWFGGMWPLRDVERNPIAFNRVPEVWHGTPSGGGPRASLRTEHPV